MIANWRAKKPKLSGLYQCVAAEFVGGFVGTVAAGIANKLRMPSLVESLCLNFECFGNKCLASFGYFGNC